MTSTATASPRRKANPATAESLRANAPASLRIYTKPQVAELLSLSERQIEILVSRGELRAFYIGRSIRFAEEAITEFIRDCETS